MIRRSGRSYVKINRWLTPLSWFYGMGVGVRNWLFDIGVLRQQKFAMPVISVGNLTVGGSGKTPHVEYLIRLLQRDYKVAVLSRGYKRHSTGFVLATEQTAMPDVGDEPFQMKKKYPGVYMAVDKDRRNGIKQLLGNDATKDVDVILLDDAYQHRYVKRDLNILLTDYHRLVIYDQLLPAGRLREPKSTKNRANMVIVSKCPADIDPSEYMMMAQVLALRPYQKLFFTSIVYKSLRPFNDGKEIPLSDITPDYNILLVAGIALPQQLEADISRYTTKVRTITYDDHHQFTPTDIMHISRTFNKMTEPKLLITTEKDASRMRHIGEVNYAFGDRLYILPIEITFLQNRRREFDNLVRTYVRNVRFNNNTKQKQRQQ
ncbi:MAG: tetraacyldisaccharide 4'-kinase [Prevotella sp.]|nr:tetraacyldisaccharide 4'-kinase [Prevotella sp.]